MSQRIIETGLKIGIYGLGQTGQSIAKFLNKKGFPLVLFDDALNCIIVYSHWAARIYASVVLPVPASGE